MKIAITGTIGSGKTEVSNIIRNNGFFVFDCDKYNSELLSKNSIAYDLLLKAFPEAFNNENIDKKILSNIIFNDSNKKIELENILHPFIIDKMNELSLTNNPFIAEVPLLFENNLEKMFDISILVISDKEIAIKRLINRGLEENDAIRRINSQMDYKIKMKRADEIIYNNDTLALLETKVLNVLNKYVR